MAAMRAQELMTREVVAVGPDTPAQEIARLLLEHRISAVPVVDASGAPIGMVSEGDLAGRNEADREARRDWWLELLSEGEALHPDFLTSLSPPKRTARDIMSAPVVTIDEATALPEIARVLEEYRIKRVPVVRDGRIVGIVSRADLVRAISAEPPEPDTLHHRGLLSTAIAGIDRSFGFGRRRPAAGSPSPAQPSPAQPSPAPAEPGLTAADFQGLVVDFKRREAHERDEAQLGAAERRRQRVTELIDHHIVEDGWLRLVHRAREAAEHGGTEFMLLRFPSELCSDGGRAINAPLPNWPATLRGEAAEIYLRWERDLKPHGFHLAARVLDFPSGFPGDIGLFLAWGE